LAWQKLDSSTLGSSGEVVTVNVEAKIFNQMLFHAIQTVGVIGADVQFNNDTGSNYASRVSKNGTASENTYVNQTDMNFEESGNASDLFFISYHINFSAEEKLVIVELIQENTSGAGTAPIRQESVHKWVNTSAQITEVDVNEVGAGSYDTDSNLSALGTD